MIKLYRGVARTPANISDGELCNSCERLKAVNCCCKVLHLRCLRRSWLRLSYVDFLGLFFEIGLVR